MAARSEFWVHVHKIASALELEGAERDERVKNLASSFYALPVITRLELERALTLLVSEVPDLDVAIRQGPPVES
jgi:hypothetical protein